ncbi:MAG: tRNA-dihydrouridine synthase [Victivallaceae bacterium]|nr:tRNA-dihydrouridine synthase [Victivallaceae bacterium]
MSMKTFPECEIWPGPMEGVARAAFVAAVAKLDLASRWMTPFLRVSAAAVPGKAVARFLAPFLATGRPATLQLMGDDPDKIAETAHAAETFGIAGITLTRGCPSRRVVRRRAGGAVLADVSMIGRIAQSVREKTGNLPFSVKIRSGRSNWREIEDFLPELAASPAIDCIFYHCRTVEESYRAVPDRRERFRRCAELAGGKPLILNGDLGFDEETIAILGECRAAGAMFARNWMRDPFLLRRCENRTAPSPEAGRRIFFDEFRAAGAPRGAVLEIARMLWGKESAEFARALAETR